MNKQQFGHAVIPIVDCPHCVVENLPNISQFRQAAKITSPCTQCGHANQNWICLKCLKIGCSRYVKNHMVDHYQKDKHSLVLSFSDLSYWCYDCDSYVESKKFAEMTQHIYHEKFGDKDQMNAIAQLQKEFKEKLNINEEPPADQEKKQQKKFDYDDLVKGIKSGDYKKICLLTGAGISVNAGIPDFRSPKIGLYATLKQKYPELNDPTELFSIDYFIKKPTVFYQFAKSFDIDKYHPTNTHFFIKLLEDKKLLSVNFTQNIDGLEVKAGVDPKKIVAAHGHMRSAHCPDLFCHTQYPINKLKGNIVSKIYQYCLDSIQKQEIVYCQKCSKPVKPDVVFFGQSLPDEFAKRLGEIASSDVVIVIGTSLMVAPFNSLIHIAKKDVPLIVMNKDSTPVVDFAKEGTKRLEIQGDCDENLRKLAEDLGWKDDLEKAKEDYNKIMKK